MTWAEIIRRMREFVADGGATTEPAYLTTARPICDAWDKPADCDGYLLTDGEPA